MESLYRLASLSPFRTDTWASLALSVLAGLSAIVLAGVMYLWPYREWTLSYRELDGPPPPSFFWGSIAGIFKAGPMELQNGWIKTYGTTFRYRILAGGWRFFSADTTALSYILSHADQFPKPEMTRRQMTEILGNGVLIAEGADHRRQRRILNPSFSQAAVRDMMPIFFDKSYELKEKLQAMITDETIEASPTPAKPEDKVEGGRKIDVMRYLGQTTLDVIGIAGFNYDFKSLSSEDNELAEAYRKMFSRTQAVTKMAIAQALIPGLNWIPTERSRVIAQSKATTERIGRRLVEEKKKAVEAAHADGLEKGHDVGKDLLSILIRANMTPDLRPDQRMTDDEVLAQITTFMLAGNETSSTALTWILYELARHSESQDRLRKEVLAVGDDRPSMDELNALPYLDAVMREVLRIDCPVPSTIRHAAQDSVIPLGQPVRGKNGKMIDSVKVKKGTVVFIPIHSVHMNSDIWGPDPEQFNPDRFLSLPQSPAKPGDEKSATHPTANAVPGVWGNLLTFLGGARNCIGYKFALAEMKSILFVLMRNFVFEELNSKPVIERKQAIVMRPRVLGEEEAGLQMPLLVKPYVSDELE